MSSCMSGLSVRATLRGGAELSPSRSTCSWSLFLAAFWGAGEQSGHEPPMGERRSLMLPLQLQASSAAPSWAWADPSVPQTCPAESLGTPAWERRFRESPRRLTPHVVHFSDRESPTVPEGKGHSGAAWGAPQTATEKESVLTWEKLLPSLVGSKACRARGLGCSEQSLHHGVPFNLA